MMFKIFKRKPADNLSNDNYFDIQDRFKFRAWNIIVERFEYFDFHDLAKMDYEDIQWHLLKFQQCTGLKDKNGKLIYEGDIVKIFHVSGTMQGHYCCDVVEWNDLRLRFDTKNYGIIEDDDVYEVIGNVYENPELLEVE